MKKEGEEEGVAIGFLVLGWFWNDARRRGDVVAAADVVSWKNEEEEESKERKEEEGGATGEVLVWEMTD